MLRGDKQKPARTPTQANWLKTAAICSRRSVPGGAHSAPSPCRAGLASGPADTLHREKAWCVTESSRASLAGGVEANRSHFSRRRASPPQAAHPSPTPSLARVKLRKDLHPGTASHVAAHDLARHISLVRSCSRLPPPTPAITVPSLSSFFPGIHLVDPCHGNLPSDILSPLLQSTSLLLKIPSPCNDSLHLLPHPLPSRTPATL